MPSVDLRQLWCYFAVNGGPVIVEELIRLFKSNRKANDGDCLSVYLKKNSQVPIQMQTHIAFLTIPRSDLGNIWCVDLHVRMRAVALLSTEEQQMQAKQRIMADTIMVGRKSLRCEKLPAPKPWPKQYTETSSNELDKQAEQDLLVKHLCG